MTPNTIICGDALAEIKKLPDECVDCVITSPPYFGLRDYGMRGQIGLEATPDAFVEKLVCLFREVRRVLKKEGTLWLNLGDSYAGSGRGRDADGSHNEKNFGTSKQSTNRGSIAGRLVNNRSLSKKAIAEGAIGNAWVKPPAGYKQKDLIGIPWLMAFALRADGWYLRQDIIWSKPNPMPESIVDRCTKSHEYVFLLSKSRRYYYDAEAIKERSVTVNREYASGDFPRGWGQGDEPRQSVDLHKSGVHKKTKHIDVDERIGGAGGGLHGHSGNTNAQGVTYEMRNKRSVWSVNPIAFKEAHFATFPEKLIEPMILAGAPPPRRYFGSLHGRGDHRLRCEETRQTVSRYRTQSGLHQDSRETHQQYPQSSLLI